MQINGGVGTILPADVLSMPKQGFLNAHPGLLPEHRGLDAVCWALSNDEAVGATVHLLDEGIDTGPILIRREMPWEGARTVVEARLQCMEFAGGAAIPR